MKESRPAHLFARRRCLGTGDRRRCSDSKVAHRRWLKETPDRQCLAIAKLLGINFQYTTRNSVYNHVLTIFRC